MDKFLEEMFGAIIDEILNGGVNLPKMARSFLTVI